MSKKINSTIKNKNGAVLLLSLVVTVFLSVLIGAAMLRSDVQRQEVTQRHSLQESFYAAETGIEHNLVLTCDPTVGLVQTRCG